MILLPVINELFTKSASSQKQKPAQMQKIKLGKMPYMHFLRAFQTFHDEFYDIENNVPITDSDIDVFSQVYKYAYSSIPNHLDDKEWTNIESHALLMKENGYVSFLEYTHEALEVGIENWASLVICDVEGDELIPHAGISGRRELTNNGEIFVPTEAFCCKNFGDQKEYMYAIDEEMLKLVMAYANQALLQIMEGQHPDITENEKWIDPRFFSQAESKYMAFADRTLDDLKQDAKIYKSSKLPEKTYTTGPVINT